MTTMVQPVALDLDRAATYIGRTRKALERMREKRTGPASFKSAGRVMFMIADLDEWLAGCRAADSRSNPRLDPTQRAPEARATRRNGNGARVAPRTPLAEQHTEPTI